MEEEYRSIISLPVTTRRVSKCFTSSLSEERRGEERVKNEVNTTRLDECSMQPD
jgi:hypothetical protein